MSSSLDSPGMGLALYQHPQHISAWMSSGEENSPLDSYVQYICEKTIYFLIVLFIGVHFRLLPQNLNQQNFDKILTLLQMS